MNAVTRLSDRAPTAVRGAVSTESTLGRIKAAYLQPLDKLEAYTRASHAWARAGLCVRDYGGASYHEHRNAVERVRSWLATCPPQSEISAATEGARALASEPADNKKNRMILALLVDSFPNARPHNPETFFEVLVQQVFDGGFPPALVARACNRLVAAHAFLPATAEIISAIKKEMDAVTDNLRMIDQTVETQINLQSASERWATEAEASSEDASRVAEDRP